MIEHNVGVSTDEIYEIKHNNETVKSRYIINLNDAIEDLKQLDVYCKGGIKIKGLSGWVLEQTIQSCIKEELSQQNNY